MSSTDLFLGFAFNLAIALAIVRFIYYPAQPNKNYVFTFLAFNTIIYFIMSVLSTAEIGVGVGFGLFAIFSVLRYRTDTMATREMTYLFVLAGLPVVNWAAHHTGRDWFDRFDQRLGLPQDLLHGAARGMALGRGGGGGRRR